MNELQLPSNQYGFWLPVFDPADDRTIKRVVLRKFAYLIRHFYIDGFDSVIVKDFQFIQKLSDSYDPIDQVKFGIKTYGWKCKIVAVMEADALLKELEK